MANLQTFLQNHAQKHPVSFHMPGHKGSALYRKYGYDAFLNGFIDMDVTEIPGADNLFQAEGVLRRCQEEYAALYGVKRSYLLINGSSGGLIAAILASVPRGGRLLMARNSHKSIFNALTLGDLSPVYLQPEFLGEYGISGEIRAEAVAAQLAAHPDITAVILPSPNYYGICSDIAAVAAVVHEAGKVLIVDQAHGAHLPFFNEYGYDDMPLSAERSGADLIINSTHKTLASLTQSAVLQVNSSRVDPEILEDRLQCIESTSPSYVLMQSLDINRDLIRRHGRALFADWHENLRFFYREAGRIDGLRLMKLPGRLDSTKINLEVSARGLSGMALESLLAGEDIFAELSTGNLTMCMTGIGNVRADYERLLSALEKISRTAPPVTQQSAATIHKARLPAAPVFVGLPESRRRVPLSEAAGCICAASIIPYPPGIPLICPGERLETDAVDYIRMLRENGEKVIGVTAGGEVFVGE